VQEVPELPEQRRQALLPQKQEALASLPLQPVGSAWLPREDAALLPLLLSSWPE
jgi:hypothetical protein